MDCVSILGFLLAPKLIPSPPPPSSDVPILIGIYLKFSLGFLAILIPEFYHEYHYIYFFVLFMFK